MKYILTQKLLGSGTYGNVYVCSKNNREYAYKQFKKFDSSVVKELAVISLLKRINSKNCVYAHHIKLRVGKVGYVMDLAIDNLWNWSMNNKKSIRYKWLPSFTQNAIRGLSELHSLDIVHGDIKTANFLVYPDMTIKICDYGFSSHSPTQEAQFIYTPAYRSPQVWKNIVDKNADVWALGISLLEVTKGDHIFLDDLDKIQDKKKCMMVINEWIDIVEKNVDTNTYSQIKKMLSYKSTDRLKMGNLGYQLVHNHKNVKSFVKVLCKMVNDDAFLNSCSYDPLLKIASDWYETDDDPDWMESEVIEVLKRLNCTIYY